MPPGIGYPMQPQAGGIFQDVSQIPPALHQQLYRQFLGEQLGFLPPSPPGGGGGVFNFQGAPDYRVQQPEQPQPAQQPKKQQQPQQPQQPQQVQAGIGWNGRQPQAQPTPVQPALPQIQAPSQAPVPGYVAPTIPSLMPVGSTISATSTPAGYLNSILFGG